MKTLPLFLSLVFLTLPSAHAADALLHEQFTVDGVMREALVSLPPDAKTKPAPLVFAFHGHGGNSLSASRSFHIHTLWPEAIVVYPQGLKTPGKLVDPEGKLPGWQPGAGEQGDRDLKFFDAMLSALKAGFKVDPKRIYSTGHSNGGHFTYLLWAERADQFAAFAPSAAAFKNVTAGLKPKPVIHVAGQNDPLVKFEWQKQTLEVVRKNNQCGDGTSWEGATDCTLYPSKVGAPVVTFLHPGTHAYPADAPALIVKFFQQHARD